MDFRRMFDDAKRQGAQRAHWQDLETLMKEHLVTKTTQRLEVDRALNESFLPGGEVTRLREKTARLSAEIEEINDVRRDIAAELAEPNS